MSLNVLYKEIGWDSLEKRRTDHKLILLYKMQTNMTPSYLSNLIPQTVNNISHYNLRNSDNIQSIHARTSQYANSFLPSTVRSWNSLSIEVLGIGKSSFSFNFIFPYIHIYFAIFISKTAFSREQSDVVFAQIA